MIMMGQNEPGRGFEPRSDAMVSCVNVSHYTTPNSFDVE